MLNGRCYFAQIRKEQDKKRMSVPTRDRYAASVQRMGNGCTMRSAIASVGLDGVHTRARGFGRVRTESTRRRFQTIPFCRLEHWSGHQTSSDGACETAQRACTGEVWPFIRI